MHIGRIGRQQYMGRLSCKWPFNTWPDELITWIFLVNLAVLTSIKAALTARMNDLWLLKVTRPEPIGYLYLSVSTPKYKQTTEMNKGRRLRVRQCKGPHTDCQIDKWPTDRPKTDRQKQLTQSNQTCDRQTDQLQFKHDQIDTWVTCVDDSAEEIVEDGGQRFRVEHSVQSPDKNCLLRIQTLRRTTDEVGIRQNPRNHLTNRIE